ncbi:MAG TPA: hypothetical protein VGF70_00310 [Solirubrobacteraceae bacterium]
MRTRDIRTSGVDQHVTCDVCGRTLLRGERAHPYLEGGSRRTVCELCTARAQREGWIPEGTVIPYDGRASSSHRRRPLFRRLRRRDSEGESQEPAPEAYEPAPPPPAPAPRPRDPATEPRHVRAIPSSPEQRMVAAVDAFNSSEHPRTIAGIARSLGEPGVTVRPAANSHGNVQILVAWELCWYRYDADLRDDRGQGKVRLEEQGTELSELAPGELEPNAVADDTGALRLGG